MEEKLVRGRNPFEQPQIGMEQVPVYLICLRFQPGKENKFRMLDTMHSPDPFYPLEYQTSFIAGADFADNYGVESKKIPMSHGMAWRILNRWALFTSVDITAPEQINKRAAMIGEKCAQVYLK